MSFHNQDKLKYARLTVVNVLIVKDDVSIQL